MSPGTRLLETAPNASGRPVPVREGVVKAAGDAWVLVRWLSGEGAGTSEYVDTWRADAWEVRNG